MLAYFPGTVKNEFDFLFLAGYLRLMNLNDISAVNRILAREYVRNNAPIVDLVRIQTGSIFKTLVATILSARTKDGTTAAASERLFKLARNPSGLGRLTRRQIEKAIFPVGFYHTKAKHLKELPGALDRLFHGRIPGTIEDLCKLPGVGRKTANLVVAVGFGMPAICVDVHVHRICNRLALLRTRTPFDTEMRLRKILPVKYWKTWNSFLVSFGQNTCRPVKPACGVCPIHRFCKRVNVKRRA